ncbi:MAG: hypothetical protein JXB38_14265 [Anaerolineales bacterium]|nr:hypothetical protein [Anaerolineales bacterium]
MKNLTSKKLNSLVIFTCIVLAFFAIPHLIDDFLFDIPEEFGLTNMQTQVLSGVFIVIFLVILVAAMPVRSSWGPSWRWRCCSSISRA